MFKTQRQIVLELLRKRGSNGVTNNELVYEHSIKQAATRIHELIKAGYNITSTPHNNTSLYVLIDDSLPSYLSQRAPVAATKPKKKKKVYFDYDLSQMYLDTESNTWRYK
jgi:hypothetical protein